MYIKNTEQRYGIITICIHWIMALLLIGMLALGLYMTDLPTSALKIKLFGLHKEFGILILMLVLVRLFWRLSNKSPSLNSLPTWERLAARAVHWAFYGFMFALPISGWLITSAANLPISFFGLFTLPNLIAPSEQLKSLFGEIHEWLAYGLIATICLHIVAALKHHFINKDNILKGMIS